MKMSLLILLFANSLLLSACSSEKHTAAATPPPSASGNQRAEEPVTNALSKSETPVEGQGLVGSVWSAQNHSSGSNLITYTFEFALDGIHIKSTCHNDVISGDLKSTVGVNYSKEGKFAEMLSGVNANIQIPGGFCSIEIPQGLIFELDGDAVYLNANGKRWASNMKHEH